MRAGGRVVVRLFSRCVVSVGNFHLILAGAQIDCKVPSVWALLAL